MQGWNDVNDKIGKNDKKFKKKEKYDVFAKNNTDKASSLQIVENEDREVEYFKCLGCEHAASQRPKRGDFVMRGGDMEEFIDDG